MSRTYRKYINHKLVSWSILKCKLCGRFITGGEGIRDYCETCSIKHHIEHEKEYRSIHKQQALMYAEKSRKKRTLWTTWLRERLEGIEL